MCVRTRTHARNQLDENGPAAYDPAYGLQEAAGIMSIALSTRTEEGVQGGSSRLNMRVV
jgi:hypothetical protein